MPILLKDMKVGMHDKVTEQVVDSFIRHSEVLELLPFDNAVSPSGGSTLTYGYVQTKLPSNTAFRALNTEYASSEAKLEQKAVNLKVFGGSFEIDRVIKDAEGMYDNMAYQIDEKVISAIGTFHNAMINGDSATNSESFDGLDKFLVGQTTEFNTGAYYDLSTMAKLEENASVFYEALIKLINRTGADALFVNEDMKSKIQTVARVLGYKTESEETFGRVVTTIGENKVRLIDLGDIAVETPAPKLQSNAFSTLGTYMITACDLSVRTGPGANYRRKIYEELTKNAKAHDYDKDGCLNYGTRVTVFEFNGDWAKIPSGWDAKRYLKIV